MPVFPCPVAFLYCGRNQDRAMLQSIYELTPGCWSIVIFNNDKQILLYINLHAYVATFVLRSGEKWASLRRSNDKKETPKRLFINMKSSWFQAPSDMDICRRWPAKGGNQDCILVWITGWGLVYAPRTVHEFSAQTSISSRNGFPIGRC